MANMLTQFQNVGISIKEPSQSIWIIKCSNDEYGNTKYCSKNTIFSNTNIKFGVEKVNIGINMPNIGMQFPNISQKV